MSLTSCSTPASSQAAAAIEPITGETTSRCGPHPIGSSFPNRSRCSWPTLRRHRAGGMSLQTTARRLGKSWPPTRCPRRGRRVRRSRSHHRAARTTGTLRASVGYAGRACGSTGASRQAWASVYVDPGQTGSLARRRPYAASGDQTPRGKGWTPMQFLLTALRRSYRRYWTFPRHPARRLRAKAWAHGAGRLGERHGRHCAFRAWSFVPTWDKTALPLLAPFFRPLQPWL